MKNIRYLITATLMLMWRFPASGTGYPVSEKYRPLHERYSHVAPYFHNAATQYNSIPPGLLEAIAWSCTHMVHLEPAQAQPSCTGMPKSYGIMGLTADGKNYFNNNLTLVAEKSGLSSHEILASEEQSILAYAKAFSQIQSGLGITSSKIEDNIPVLKQMTELPEGDDVMQFAIDAWLYQIFFLLNEKEFCETIGISPQHIDMKTVFGEDNLNVLSSGSVTISKGKVKGKKNSSYSSKQKKNNGGAMQLLSSDYAPALWNAAASCNYTVGRTQSISAVTIHDVEGTYSGCISWFKNCNASVSAHYVLRSSDGQVTQMVLEANKAWHVGSENPYTIGLEHEGYLNDASWYTTAMYTSSADLVRDICNSGYGINPHRTGFWPWLATTQYNQSGIPGSCTKIKGHQHFPNQTHSDPGPNWNWDYYFKLINNNPTITALSAASGTFYDTGGGAGNYADDERLVWVINPAGATSVTLTFTSFSLENTWDYLYIYDGNSVWSPLIGYYTGTTGPGTVTSSGGSITVEFRSDCATTAAGWAANWTSNTSAVVPANLMVTPNGCPQIGVSLSWTNSGSGWYADVSTDPTFTAFFNKDVSSLTSVAVPGGFCEYPSCNSYLEFDPNVTYYWRIYDGTTWYNGSSFTTPVCSSTDPSCSGNFYDAGGSGGSYSGNEDYTLTIAPAFATSVTMAFSSFDTENGFDFLYLYDGPDTLSFLLGAYTGTTNPGTVTAGSGALTVRFKSDPFVNNSGWAATWSCAQNNTPPTTQVSATGNWQTQDFTATFTDADQNGSGLDLLFYQPLEYNGTEWRANDGNGFFNDNFDAAIHPDWTSVSGTWAINSAYLNQTDESNGNTNIYAQLTQTTGEIYLYHWSMNMGGTGSNRRGGMHFFCDDPSLPNRGNSYFVYFRVDDDKCQIYKVYNDSFDIKTNDSVSVNPGAWYDCKVIFNPQSGQIKAFLNNLLVSQWTDPSPYSAGSYVSLRNGSANIFYNDFKVYRARTGNSVTVTVGAGPANDIRYQNPDPLTPSCRIKSIVKDSFDLWSAPASLDINIDWTPPSDAAVNDGGTWDTDTIFSGTQLSANWTNSIDTNSDIVRYLFAFGTGPGLNDVAGWTDNGLNTSVTVTGLSLSYGQTYYASVKSEDGAGLFSNVISSDGAYLALYPSANFSPSSSVVCAGDSVTFTNYSQNAISYQWQFAGGSPATGTQTSPVVTYDTSGFFAVTLVATNGNGNDTITDYITVHDKPAVTIITTNQLVCNGNADGVLGAAATGGNPPYAYAWSNGQTGAMAFGLIPGLYTVTVTDSLSCSEIASGMITNQIFSAQFSQSDDTINLAFSDSVVFTGQSAGSVSWSWNFGNGTYSTAQNPTAFYDSTGTFQVELIASDGFCTDTAYGQVVVVLITESGLQNPEYGILVYPNPSKRDLGIRILDFGFVPIAIGVKMKIFNVFGLEVFSATSGSASGGESLILNPNSLIHLDLPSGIYFYKIIHEGDETIANGKLIIE